jgi:hypothetical protein
MRVRVIRVPEDAVIDDHEQISKYYCGYRYTANSWVIHEQSTAHHCVQMCCKALKFSELPSGCAPKASHVGTETIEFSSFKFRSLPYEFLTLAMFRPTAPLFFQPLH